MSSSESPAPPHTATRDTSASSSPAARTPHDVPGSASCTRETNAANVSGVGNVPMRPNPTSAGTGASAKMSNAGSSYGCAARIAASNMAAQPRGGDDLHPVLGHPFDGSDAADRRCGALVREELPGAGDAPAAVRIVADVPGARGEHGLADRVGILGGDVHHPLVQCPGRPPPGPAPLRTVSPSASASASDTPGDAASALVWAVNNARPVRIIRCSSAPLAVLAATVSTPRSSSG